MKKYVQQFICLILTVCMLLTLPILGSAEESVSSNPTYRTNEPANGSAMKNAYNSGTRQFEIDSADELADFAEACKTCSFEGATITLKTDIIWNEGNATTWKDTAPSSYHAWTPIGNDANFCFKGSFDGNGHTISGIYYVTDGTFNGLFRFVGGNAVIKNLGLVNSCFVNTRNDVYFGALIGRVIGASTEANKANVWVSGCYVDATLVSTNTGLVYIGGIVCMVGRDGYTNLTVKESVFAGSIISASTSADSEYGGIVGRVGVNGNTLPFEVTVEDCANYGTIPERPYSGGLVGRPLVHELYKSDTQVLRCVDYSDVGLVGGIRGDGTTTTTGSVDLTATDTTTKGEKIATALFALDFDGRDATDTTFATAPTWVTRKGDYPLPRLVYDNFFKIELKYIQSSKINDGLYSVRLIAEISSLEYSDVGFCVEASYIENGKTVTKKVELTAQTVYRSINAVTEDGYQKVSAPNGRYYVALAITDIPVSIGTVTYKVTPIGNFASADPERGMSFEIVYESGSYHSAGAVDDATVYKAVIGSNTGAALLQEYGAFAEAFCALTGSKITFVKDTELVETDDFDFLIGDTTHELSHAAKNLLEGERYSITAADNKTVITAYNNLILVDALKYYCNNMIVNGECEVPVDGYVSGEYTALSIGADRYCIVYAEDDEKYQQALAKELADLLAELSGNTYTVYAESDERTVDKAIYIGNIGNKRNGFSYNQYGIKIENGEFYLCGWNRDRLHDACELFQSILKAYRQTVAPNSTELCFYSPVGGCLTWNYECMAYSTPLPEEIWYTGANTAANNGIVLSYENVSSDVYDSYLALLEANGYTSYYSRQASNNRFAGYCKGNEGVWVYYLADLQELRVTLEPYSPIPTFSADGAKVTEASLVQFGLQYTSIDKGPTLGMSYVITLEDGRYVIVDGGRDDGGSSEYPDYYGLAEKLYQFLAVNNKRSDGKIKIAAWILTHSHSDHYDTFQEFGEKYGKTVELEYLLWNIPTDHSVLYAENVDTYLNSNAGKYQSYFENSKVYTLHTGYAFSVGGVEFEFLSTYEDMYPNALTEMNNTCLTFRATFNSGDTDEAKAIFLADIYKAHGDRLAAMWGDYLKTDIVQVAHHGWDNGGSQALYEKINANYALWSNSNQHLNHSSAYGNYIYRMLRGINSNVLFYANCDNSGNPINTTVTFDGGITCTKSAQ
ncbi:MAG: MBL fold metallo-hydrolase [Clostridia bacterium]|nr:MBL fold metallo-hydrolase [Clostridia bacterium]